ncbi:MAG TPA: response regulator transcription factor [Burkholderiaceae bacterium]|nr:response regulator transcription factor [Burkholderiaceae bacterium]
MKILLVDDHTLITDALKVLLLDVDADAEIHTAADADAAMKLVAEHPDADLMLLDLGLPSVSGTSLLEAVVAQVPDLKILVLSGTQDARNVLRVLQLGAAGFVPKSMASETLVSAIRFVLSGGFYIPGDLLEEAQRLGPLSGAPERLRENAPPGGVRVALTERQEQVLQLLARGAPIKIICRELGLSEGTVKTHVTAIYRAFGASNRTEALLAARRHGYDIG